MDHLCKLSYILLVVGAINWGLYGLLGLDLVSMLLGSMPMLMKLVYVFIGVSGVYALYGMLTKTSSCCSKQSYTIKTQNQPSFLKAGFLIPRYIKLLSNNLDNTLICLAQAGKPATPITRILRICYFIATCALQEKDLPQRTES